MKLDTVYARFFRSLNFDYVRMSSRKYKPDPWDATPGGANFPFVRLQLDEGITTIVGGNESGKSQLLAAIKGALTGTGFDRSDFCRYSQFFSVDKVLQKPEFGVLFTEVSNEEVAIIREMTDVKGHFDADRIALFRMNSSPQTRLYLRSEGKWLEPLNVKKPSLLRSLGVPLPFEIDATVPLPDSVPLSYLATGKATAAVGRNTLRSVWDILAGNSGWFTSSETVTRNAGDISTVLGRTQEADPDELKKFALAGDLLLKVAGLQRSQFEELQTAVRTKNGYANSIVDTINSELAKSLNFPHWWSQDSHFELFVSLFEFDLVFMIRDRTGRSYGFDERSDGLKYFLSYFVQYLAHEAPSDGGPEILLMDEPDRFLSSSGQQDLLRVFADFARPEDADRKAVQVAYVTHSPFLIDKNHSERIRVLEKGEHDEGTRVVASVAQNHYEPLRSAFGSFVGETAFIGNCNLMLEGASDQILIAGISSWLGRRNVPQLERLDLNKITLVPAGGVSQIPYLVYLARGRDVEQPAVIVLLDGDKPARDARATIQRGGARRKPLVDDGLVLQLSDAVLDGITTSNPAGRMAIEDLIPLRLAVLAVESYCREFVPDLSLSELTLDQDAVFPPEASEAVGKRKGPVPENKGLLDGLETAIQRVSGREDFHLDKIGFARSLVKCIGSSAPEAEDTSILEANFRVLLSELGKRQRIAMRDKSVERISSRINRSRSRFLQTHVTTARREHVLLLIEEISGQLDNSVEAEAVRAEMRSWHPRFKLDEDPRVEIDDIGDLEMALKSLAYAGVRGAENEPFDADADAEDHDVAEVP